MVWCVRLLAVLVVLAGAVARAQSPFDRLRPDDLTSARALRDRLVEIDRWRSDSFRVETLGRLGRWCAEQIDARGADAEVITGGLGSLIAKPSAEEVKKLERAGPGEKVEPIKLNVWAAEASWLVGFVGDFVDQGELTEELKRAAGMVAGQARTDAAKDAVDRALRKGLAAYETYQRQVQKIRVLSEQPAGLLKLLGLNPDTLAALAREVAADLPSPDTDRDPNAVKATVERLDVLVRNTAEWSSKATALLTEVKENYTAAQDELEALAEYYSRVASAKDIDLGTPGAPRLFVRLQQPQAGSWHGRETLFHGQLWLTIPRGPGDETTIDTGVRFGTLRLQVGATGVTPTIVQDQFQATWRAELAVVERALRQLGVPGEWSIESLDVASADLSGFEVACSSSVASVPTQGIAWAVKIRPGDIQVGLRPKEVLENLLASKGADADPFRRMSREVEAYFRGQKRALPGNWVSVRDLKLKGSWAAGTLEAQGWLGISGLGEWPVQFGWTGSEGARVLAPLPHALPAEILKSVRTEIGNRLRGWLEAGLDPADWAMAQRIADAVSLENVTFDPAGKRVRGQVRLSAGKVWGLEDPIGFTIALDGGKLAWKFGIDLESHLKSRAKAIVKALAERLLGNAKKEVLEQLRKLDLDLPGIALRVPADAEIVHLTAAQRPAGEAFRLSLEAEVGGTRVRVSGVLLLGWGEIKDGKLRSPRFDFSEAQFAPTPRELLAKVLGPLAGEGGLVRVNDVRVSFDGVRFGVSLSIESLGGETPIGEFGIGSNGLELPTLESLGPVVCKRLSTLVADGVWIKDTGVVKELTVDCKKSRFAKDGAEVWLAGKFQLVESLMLPALIQVYPEVRVEIDPGAATALLDLIKSVSGGLMPTGAAEVTKERVITTKPYGVEFDVSTKAFFGLTLRAGGVRITQNGPEFPDSITARIPGEFPLGTTGLTMVNLGATLHRRTPGLDLLGDLTVGSGAVAKIAKITCTLSTEKPTELTLSLDGLLIVADSLTLMKMTGVADFREGVLRLDACTTGFVDKVLQVRAQSEVKVNGPGRTISQRAGMGVMGLKIIDTEVVLNLREFKFIARADVDLLIAAANLGFEASPNLADITARASLSFEIMGFEIAGASLLARPSIADLQTSVIGVKIRVITPGLETLTPGVVGRAIEKLFEFNFSLDALLRREIVINLIDDQGKPVKDHEIGRGEPIRTDQPPSPDNMAPPTDVPESKPAGENEPKGPPPGPASTEPTGPPPSGTDESVEGVNVPKDRLPSQVYTYKKGGASIRFRPESGDGPFEMVHYSGDKESWVECLLVSKAVRDHLMNPKNVILDRLKLRVPEGVSTPFCHRHKAPWPSVFVMLTVEETSGQVNAAWLFEKGTVQTLKPDAYYPLPKIAQSPLEKLYAWLTGSDSKKLEAGDFRLLRDWAESRLKPDHGGFSALSDRQDVRTSGDQVVPGYFFSRVINDGKQKTTLVGFQLRESHERLELPETHPLAPALKPGPDRREAHERLLKVILDATFNGRGVSLLWADKMDGSAQRVLLALGKGGKSGAQVIAFDLGKGQTWTVREWQSVYGLSRARSTTLADPVWVPDRALGIRVFDALKSGLFDEICITETGGLDAVALCGAIEGPDWKKTWRATVLEEVRTDTGALSVRPAESLDGASVPTGEDISALFEKSFKARVKREAPYRDLDTPDARRWFAHAALLDKQGWERYFGASPRLLFLLKRTK